MSYGRFKEAWSHVYELPAAEGSYELRTIMNGNIVVKINALAADEIPEKLLVVISSDYFENVHSGHLGGRVTSSQVSPVMFFYPPLQLKEGARVEIFTSCEFIQRTDEELSEKMCLATCKQDEFVLEVNEKVVTYSEANGGRLWNTLDQRCEKVTVERREEDSKRVYKIVLEESLPKCCFISSYFYRMGF
jgi:hypothetical protein